MNRREFVVASSGALFGLWGKPAEASLAIAVSLRDLVAHSSQVWVAEALEAHSEWVESKAGRYIVTHTRLRQDEIVSASEGEASELWVRTLGGSVGHVGQLVHGEADIKLGERNVLFMRRAGSTYQVTARAQGQFPVRETAGTKLLAQSQNLPHLARAEHAAVKQLAGKELMAALRLIRAVKR